MKIQSEYAKEAVFDIVDPNARLFQQGRIKQGENTYNISSLSQGVYFMIIKQNNHTQSLKFIEQ